MIYSKEQQLGKKRVKKSKNFTPKIKNEIFKRDGYQCVKCKRSLIERVPHHIVYKSQGGTGDKRNGATVCRWCHDWAHHKCKGPNGEPSSEGRKWFEEWQERRLDENGDYRR